MNVQGAQRSIHPLIAALVALVLLALLTLAVRRIISDEFIRAAIEPGATASLQDSLLSFVFVGGNVIAVLAAFVIYLLLAARWRGKHYAERLTRDLAASRQEFQQLYEHSPVPYVLLSPDGMVTQLNHAARHFLGYTADELAKKDFFELLVVEDDAVAPEEVRERFVRSVAVTGEEARVLTKAGVKRWAVLSIFQIGNRGQHTHRGLATLFDITEQKEIDRAKTEFVSIASHQLKTPLSTSNWYLEMIRDEKTGALNEKQREYVEKIDLWNRRMIELVDMLLDVSRIEMGTLRIAVERVVPNELIASILDELKPHVEAKRLAVRYNAAAAEPIATDHRLLRIALQNLVSNAVKYTPEGGSVHITVDYRGNAVAFAVADTGYGIPPEAQDKIFTKMFRAENARKADAKGTGLGLYLTKSFVEALGGTVTFTSKLGEGSIFTITLPRGGER